MNEIALPSITWYITSSYPGITLKLWVIKGLLPCFSAAASTWVSNLYFIVLIIRDFYWFLYYQLCITFTLLQLVQTICFWVGEYFILYCLVLHKSKYVYIYYAAVYKVNIHFFHFFKYVALRKFFSITILRRYLHKKKLRKRQI